MSLSSRPKTIGRPCQPHLWQRNVRKRLRESGQAYVGVSGEVRPPRQSHSKCSPQCQRGCIVQFTVEQLRQVHGHFWSLNDTQKDDFYAEFTERRRPARVRTKAKVSRKMFTYLYFLEAEANQRRQVCQEFFSSTLDISKARVYHFFQSNKCVDATEPATDE